MISRITIYSLLLALMLVLSLRLWHDKHPDNCTLYNAGDHSYPSSMMVVSGTRQIEVPCTDWTMRQPLGVQMFCLLDLLLAALFFFNALSDLQRWMQTRRRMRQTQ